MGSETRKPLLGSRQNLFLALTIVVVVIILLITPNLQASLLPITLITNVLIISNLLLTAEQHHRKAAGGETCESDDKDPGYGAWAANTAWSPSGFQDEPDGFASRNFYDEALYEVAGLQAPGADLAHPLDFTVGGVAVGEGPSYAPLGMGVAALGADHRDGLAVPELNPFQLNRAESRAEPWGAAPGAPGPQCGDIGDSPYAEARAAFDGDRVVVEHAKWRNDPYRVAAGRANRQEQFDKYFREELDEEEDRPWWGRADF